MIKVIASVTWPMRWIKDRSVSIFLRKKKRCKICGRRLFLWERQALCRKERHPTVMDVAKAVLK